MNLDKILLLTYTDLDLNEYIMKMNNLSNNPINKFLLDELVDLTKYQKIDYNILYKYDIVNHNTDINKFLKRYLCNIENNYIDKIDFIDILLFESPRLYDYYNTILTYRELYLLYQKKLEKIITLRSKYVRIKNLLDIITEQYKTAIKLKDGSKYDELIDKEIQDLTNIESELKKMKIEIYNETQVVMN